VKIRTWPEPPYRARTDKISRESGVQSLLVTSPPLPPSLHLQAVNVIDVVNTDVLWNSSVTIDNGCITAVGSQPPRGATVLDLTGHWVSPGLVDMHAHLTFEPRAHQYGAEFGFDEDPSVTLIRGIRNIADAMRVGICLIRDMGGRRRPLALLRAAALSGQFVMPELTTSGEPLCLAGGHGSNFGQTLAEISAARLEELCTHHRLAGHEWLKVMNGPELWADVDLDHIVKVCHAQGLKIAIHAFTPDGIRAAVNSGADTVEHAMVSDADIIKTARTKMTTFVPTYYCSWISLRPRFLYTQSDSEIAHLQYWRDYLVAARQDHIASGLPTLPGTDAGCSPCTFDDYFDELLEFEHWGYSPIETIKAASIKASEVLGRAEKFGSINPRKWANLMVLKQSPTETTTALRNPDLVLLRGSAVVNNLGMRWT